MSPRPLRARLLDLAVATVCVACVASPLLPGVGAATEATDAPVVETSGTVDQRVLQSGIISSPLDVSFDDGTTGTRDGGASWDLYTTAPAGLKLVLSTDRVPALRDGENGIDIADMATTAAAWSVPSGERRFGFTTTGEVALARFDGGASWRGFDGGRSVEVARRTAPMPRTRTRVRLRAQYGTPLPGNARPRVTVNATAVANL